MGDADQKANPPPLVDLHPYDGKERCFRHDVPHDPAVVRGVLARFLGVAPPVDLAGVRFDLSFYSGGIGVFDRLFVSIPVDTEARAKILAHLRLVPCEEGLAHEDVRWLLGVDNDEGVTLAADAACAAFIQNEKRPFQPAIASASALWVDPESSVNGWTVATHVDDALHVIAFEQG